MPKSPTLELWQFFNQFPKFQPTGDRDEPEDYSQVVGRALAQIVGETCELVPPTGWAPPTSTSSYNE
ncbi:MAG: hypothetical protein K0V04_45780 [Deltaproteobacteria bacterium]|nr:hypothetical protein [Deltaproteobacteria bacterium]